MTLSPSIWRMLLSGCYLAPKPPNIPELLCSLHCFPVKQRIDFKILFLTCKTLRGPVPASQHKLFSPHALQIGMRCSSSAASSNTKIPKNFTFFLQYTSGTLQQFVVRSPAVRFFTHECYSGKLQHVLAHSWYNYVLVAAVMTLSFKHFSVY